MIALGGVTLGLIALTSTVGAQPPGPTRFCEIYLDSPACAAGEVTCTTCHVAPPELNLYGEDVAANLAPSEGRPLHEDVFSDLLADALHKAEPLDSDGDGYTNLEEIDAGTSPSDSRSTPAPVQCNDEGADDYDVCGYDYDYAFKKVFIDFCGHSPSLVAREAFAGAGNQNNALHEALDACLDSEYWRGIDGRVWNLANAKIGPVQAVKSGMDSGPIALADYADDYAYWTWTQTDDRDVRLVLVGQEFVKATYSAGKTVYEPWDRSPGEDYTARGYDQYQAVVKDRRAGLLTHRWFLMSNTMFTAIPRTTAAQAYRAFLGYDIARLEGLNPVPSEPADYDRKGVQVQACANCHSTLDPMSYPFSRYQGIGDSVGFDNQYQYVKYRLDGFVRSDGEGVVDTPEAGVLMGQPVADLIEWAEVAANSEAFRRATVLDYWKMLLQEAPRANEQQVFGDLVAGLQEHYSVERMLHDLVDTEAYGAP
jgi:hypothetical protein